jgi:amino-acid N-acetyltransferase
VTSLLPIVKPTDLRGILRYIPSFREKTFVIALDGAVVTDENFANILRDVAVLRSLNIRVVLVHGAAQQIQQLGDAENVVPSDLTGSGITDPSTLRLALTAANRLTHEILEGLADNDIRAASTNAVIAHPLGILLGQDHQMTGKVERIDTGFLNILLEHGVVPVAPPLGLDGEGKTFRVNSDSVALEIAEAVKAAKLIYITSADGLVFQNRLLRQVPVAQLDTMLAKNKGDFSVETLSKAQCAAIACRNGIQRVHIINGRVDEGLLTELFSNEGVGTMIYANEYEQIRKALKKDITSILKLTKASVASAELVKRTRATIEKQLTDYYIYEIDRNPVACIALHIYPEQKKGELAYLFVASSHENQGIGRKLIQFIEARARELDIDELITLSTQAFSYFQTKGGFVEGTTEDLPPERREKYTSSGRNSKVLVKRLKVAQTA